MWELLLLMEPLILVLAAVAVGLLNLAQAVLAL
jgi:hypothetical protein